MPWTEIIAGGVVLGCFGIFQALVVHYAKAFERERIHRWLEAEARKVTEDVQEILARPLGTDAELLDAVRPAGMPDPVREPEAPAVSDVDDGGVPRAGGSGAGGER